ncbi:hypothetical protein [Methanococcoides burtonii]|uniref:hypothetical protein n=1 Tax=Methanococcoides burtonii TaxID=29291 RepID=UPI0000399378|nr:hypothetical protein [Methanococcoides burtonii]
MFKDLATGMMVFIIPLYVANIDHFILQDMPIVLSGIIVWMALRKMEKTKS